MDTKQQNTLLVGAVLAGLLSLPMTWLTIHNVQPSFGNGLGGLFGSEFPRMSLDVNGLNGHLTLLIKSPIWFVVAIAIGASVLQLMKHSKAFAIPSIVEWIAALVGVIWTAAPVIPMALTGKATLGIGWVLAFASAVIPLVCLCVPTRKEAPLHIDAGVDHGSV